MARKDFDQYYNQICEQYFELQDMLKEISQEVSEGIVEPERIEQLKKTIQPIENNYRTLGYIKYLLDKPTRKQKQKMYKKMNQKLLKQCEGKTQEDLVKEGQSILSNLSL